MIGQCKYAFQMLRYAFGIKGNSVAAVIMVIAGLALEFISHGTNFLGSFFVVVLSMFPVQFLYSISLSDHVASSPYRKRLQTSMPTLMNLTLNIGIFTLLNIIKAVEIYLFPEDAELIIGSLIMLSIAELILAIYTGIVFKYYILATIILVVFFSIFGGIGGWIMAFQEQVYSFYSLFAATGYIFMGRMSFVGAVIISYVLIFVGAGFQYLVSLAIYRKPLSKRAQGAAMKRYLK
mgnify:FL=1